MRALPHNANTSIYNAFEVVKPFDVLEGQAAPAFGKLGLGTQYKSLLSAEELLEQGFLKIFK